MTRPLTAKQEAFCRAYINAASASAAYREVYDVKRMNDASVNRTAFELLQNLKITARVQELRDMAAQKAAYTLADHMQRLRTLSELSEDAEQYAAAIKAEELRGKVSGFYTEKVDLSNSDGTLRPNLIKIVAKR
jgi:phage terminase small subunit